MTIDNDQIIACRVLDADISAGTGKFFGIIQELDEMVPIGVILDNRRSVIHGPTVSNEDFQILPRQFLIDELPQNCLNMLFFISHWNDNAYFLTVNTRSLLFHVQVNFHAVSYPMSELCINC